MIQSRDAIYGLPKEYASIVYYPFGYICRLKDNSYIGYSRVGIVEDYTLEDTIKALMKRHNWKSLLLECEDLGYPCKSDPNKYTVCIGDDYTLYKLKQDGTFYTVLPEPIMPCHYVHIYPNENVYIIGQDIIEYDVIERRVSWLNKNEATRIPIGYTEFLLSISQLPKCPPDFPENGIVRRETDGYSIYKDGYRIEFSNNNQAKVYKRIIPWIYTYEIPVKCKVYEDDYLISVELRYDTIEILKSEIEEYLNDEVRP